MPTSRRPSKRSWECAARVWTALAVTLISANSSPALDAPCRPALLSRSTRTPTLPCWQRRNARPHLTLRSRAFSLRGGRDLEDAAPLIYVPDFVDNIQRAVDQAVKDGSTVMINANGPPEVYDWSEYGGGSTALRIRGNCRIRGEGTVELTGSSLLEQGSGGTIETVRWHWKSAMSSHFPEMMSVQGGPWTFTRCELKATDVCVVRCRGLAVLALEDTAIGGHGMGITDDDRTTSSATEGVAAEGHSRVQLRDCTFQFCGAWSSAACRASHCSNVTAERCFFFQNSFCGVAVHGSCAVWLKQCTFLEHETAALVAVLARNASLELSNVTVDGRWWADERRPGTMAENSSTHAPRMRKRRLPSDEKLQGLFDFVAESAEHIVADWDALCGQGESDYEPVLAHLEHLVLAMGGAVQRMQTGRQRLQLPRHVAITSPFHDPDDARANATADKLFEEWLCAGNDTDPEFETLPPLLLATLDQRAPPGAPTLCVYVHMEPCLLSALGDRGLIAEEQALLIEDGDVQLSRRRYGGDAVRAFCFLAALQSFEAAGDAPPVHLKLVFDFLEEAHSEILHKRVRKMRAAGGFLEGVDGAVLLLGEWISALQPALVRGYRGLASCQLGVECAAEDLHSGHCGGGVREAFPELMHLLASLQDEKGTVRVPGIAKWATPISEEERQELRQEEALCKMWHRPSLTIHGVEGAWADPGMKSVIPSAPTAKLSVRLSPGMDPNEVLLALQHHLENKFESFKSPNRMTFKVHTGWRAWRASARGWLLEAAVRATERVHGATPEMIYHGSSSPVPGMFEEALGGREVLVLPLWHREEELEADEQHRQTQGYLLESIKIAAALMDEVACRKYL